MDRPSFFLKHVAEVPRRASLRLKRDLVDTPRLLHGLEVFRYPQVAVSASDDLDVIQAVTARASDRDVGCLAVLAGVDGEHDALVLGNSAVVIGERLPCLDVDVGVHVSRDPLAQDLGAEGRLCHAVDVGLERLERHAAVAARRVRLQ